jgi:mannose-1-phosphate guanylyltransferase
MLIFVVAPSDHLILKKMSFYKLYRKALILYQKIGDNLLTLGIKPNRPETGYGYIQIADQVGRQFLKGKDVHRESLNLNSPNSSSVLVNFIGIRSIFMWNVNSVIKQCEKLLPEIVLKLNGERGCSMVPKSKTISMRYSPLARMYLSTLA